VQSGSELAFRNGTQLTRRFLILKALLEYEDRLAANADRIRSRSAVSVSGAVDLELAKLPKAKALAQVKCNPGSGDARLFDQAEHLCNMPAQISSRSNYAAGASALASCPAGLRNTSAVDVHSSEPQQRVSVTLRKDASDARPTGRLRFAPEYNTRLFPRARDRTISIRSSGRD